MKMMRFSMYYSTLRFSVLLGMSKTELPMDLIWRWNYWQRRICYQHRR